MIQLLDFINWKLREAGALREIAKISMMGRNNRAKYPSVELAREKFKVVNDYVITFKYHIYKYGNGYGGCDDFCVYCFQFDAVICCQLVNLGGCLLNHPHGYTEGCKNAPHWFSFLLDKDVPFKMRTKMYQWRKIKELQNAKDDHIANYTGMRQSRRFLFF